MKRRHRSFYRRKKKREKVIVLVIAIVCVCSILGYAVLKGNAKNNGEKHGRNEPVSEKAELPKELELQKEPELPKELEIQMQDEPEEKETVPELAEEKKDISYFDDAVFIGDSRVEGFVQSSGLSNAAAYTHKGLTVNKVFSDPIVNMNGKLVTIMDALKNTQFSKVYIMLGINEMGWVYSNMFIEKYEKIISEIRKINPDAIIYVQSILPVSQKVSETHAYIHNKKITEYNRLLQEMAERKNVCYLNIHEMMADAKGCLPEEAAFDGIHLKKEYCIRWQEYLLTHTAK